MLEINCFNLCYLIFQNNFLISTPFFRVNKKKYRIKGALYFSLLRQPTVFVTSADTCDNIIILVYIWYVLFIFCRPRFLLYYKNKPCKVWFDEKFTTLFCLMKIKTLSPTIKHKRVGKFFLDLMAFCRKKIINKSRGCYVQKFEHFFSLRTFEGFLIVQCSCKKNCNLCAICKLSYV